MALNKTWTCIVLKLSSGLGYDTYIHIPFSHNHPHFKVSHQRNTHVPKRVLRIHTIVISDYLTLFLNHFQQEGEVHILLKRNSLFTFTIDYHCICMGIYITFLEHLHIPLDPVNFPRCRVDRLLFLHICIAFLSRLSDTARLQKIFCEFLSFVAECVCESGFFCCDVFCI